MTDEIALFNEGKEVIAEMFNQKNPDKQKIFLRIANTLLEINHVVTLDDTDEMYVYEDLQGFYQKDTTEVNDQLFRIYPYLSKADIQEVIAKIKCLTHFPREELNPPHFLGLKNCCYNFNTNETEVHSADHYLTRSINVFNRPSVYPDEFLKFLYDVVGPENIDLIFEIIGYCLMNGYPYHKAFMFVGIGANGKSTLLQVIEKFLGGDNISHISLQDFERQFASARLYGKLSNISADLPSKPVRHTGIFKQLTGGDTFWADIKYHKSGISFVNSAKMFFSMNRAPAILYDDTDAVWRRIMIINFPNQFKGDKADRKIIEKITTDKELSGIFNLSLRGLSRINEHGGFLENIKDTRREYIKISNTVQAFAEDMLEEAIGSADLPDSEVWTGYLSYCANNKLQARVKNVFTQWLKRALLSVERRRSGNNFFWMGIKWK